MNEIKKLEDQTLLDNIKTATISVLSSSTPKELLDSVITLKLGKDALKGAKMELKEITDAPSKIIKRVENQLKELELEIKSKVLETYENEIVVKKKIDEETGEVQFKEYENNNLERNLFTFAKEKKVMVVDNKAITYETHPHLFKQVWVIDTAKLKEEPMENLPMKEKITPARVGIQYASIGKKLLKGEK